ncbi:hypothetical protein LSH36_40g17000 [Paralvinella palmiformis]|uniref:Elongation factor 1-delta n=1 Tax=Paralvinella palmiformis TaxID=53620 RepID=A0AAD9K968_9ANNE|nr:hypothetical protein LSH36_40g17000 [Paralvinella palmiformis]
MTSVSLLSEVNDVWFEKWRCDDAECKYQMIKCGTAVADNLSGKNQITQSSLVSEIAKARQHIQKSLKNEVIRGTANQVDNVLISRLEAVEFENKDLRIVTQDLQAVVKKLESRIAALEKEDKAENIQENKKNEDDDDDDIDLFGSDDEDEEAERIKEERLKSYQERKAKKPSVVAKSNVILDVKPWDDETDMAELEKCVRSISMDGLLWGTGKLLPVGYGIKKLTISCVVEDEKVSIEELEEKITAFEDLIQSVDIAAFNKI